MKNDEILISIRIEEGQRQKELSFLVNKDISFKSLIQGFYYGLKKAAENEPKEQVGDALTMSYKDCFNSVNDYLKTHSNILILYTIMGAHRNIDFSDTLIDFADDDKEKPIFDCSLTTLGIVTSSVVLFTDKTEVENIPPLFMEKDKHKTYILRDNNTLEYNISTRRLNVIEPTELDILPAGEMPGGKDKTIMDVIIPPILTAGGMFGVRALFANSSSTMMAMSLAMPVVSLMNTFYTYKRDGKKSKESVKEWKERYENYINKKIIKKIVDMQRDEIVYLNKVYPEMNVLFQQLAGISASIFARSQNDKDFMRITLGKSDKMKPLFEIKNEKKDEIFYDIEYRLETNEGDYPTIKIFIPEKEKKKRNKKTVKDVQKDNTNRFLLTELPDKFANTQDNAGEMTGFKYLRDVTPDEGEKKLPPLLLDLRDIGTLGVISKDENFSYSFIRHLVMELAFYQSPEDVQMVFFMNQVADPDIQRELVSDYMFLPHTNELFENQSQFVFDQVSAGNVFSTLQSIMAERKKNKSDDEEDGLSNDKQTQIICFIVCDYNIKETAFSKFIPEAPKEGEEYVNELGLTFVYICREKGMLPKYCGSIVELDDKRRVSDRYNLLSHETLSRLAQEKDAAASTDDIIEYTDFTNDYIFGGRYQGFTQAFQRLSSIYYTRIAENGKVPSAVTLFELYKDEYSCTQEQMQGNGFKEIIEKSWQNSEDQDTITHNMKVAMGRNEHDITYLDLHENSDGPHMLVAGTTGSGKSETIITYLIGLCVKYSPMDLNLLLVDMKGGGFSDRLGSLPHCVGTVTNTAGEAEGISATYMLKRFLTSLNAEIKNRQIILAKLGVDNTDAYIRVYRKLKKINDWKNREDKAVDRQALIEDIKRGNNEKQIRYIDGDMSDLKRLSHLILVVDEFTELKRFSNESGDIDFIAEITTIARVGRTLGLHIILVSQNIEGAINDDIRVNTKSKICLKVATKQASKEMLGTVDAAAATMPGHGRAYILVGTGSRYEYFQSAYTGANRNMDISPVVSLTQVTTSGGFDTKFYISDKDNEEIKKKNKNVSPEDTQLKHIVNLIEDISGEGKWEVPKPIFLDPLKTHILEPDSLEEWVL